MSLFLTEGIVTHVIKYQEHDQILTVFTPDLGVIKVFASGSTLGKSQLRGTHLGLTRVEVVCSEGKSDLYKCREISLLNAYLHLRQNASILNAALEMTKAIAHSQFPHKPAAELFRLFAYYLDKLKGCEYPETLQASFLMKILKHEGLLQINFACSNCQTSIKEMLLYEGECYCRQHAPASSLEFNEEQSLVLYLITHTRRIQELLTLSLDQALQENISTVFQAAFFR